jgi:hypothetical protein
MLKKGLHPLLWDGVLLYSNLKSYKYTTKITNILNINELTYVEFGLYPGAQFDAIE